MNAETRSPVPFAFRLAVSYAVADADLEVQFAITNTGDETLPASIGAYPAFNWPLSLDIAKGAYTLELDEEEREPIRRLKDGLLLPKPEPAPILGKSLTLSEELFTDDAITSISRRAEEGARLLRWSPDHVPSRGHSQDFLVP
jgi:galactose mutarotase-like enzyme